jgi:hypothetical protein
MTKKTRMTPDWIAKVLAANPCTLILDEKTGKPNGLIRACPARISWPNLFTAKGGKNDDGSDKAPTFGCQLMFPPGANLSLLTQVASECASREFPDKIVNGQFVGLHFPFRNQAEKHEHEGYEPDGIFFNTSSKFKPHVGFLDGGGNWQQIVDESMIYPGVWVIPTLNVYAYKDPRRKGVSFGIAGVLKIADDERFGGTGASNPHHDFKGVAVDSNVDFSKAMGQMPQGMPGGVPAAGVMPTTGIMPGAPVGGGLPVQALPTEPNVDDLM